MDKKVIKTEVIIEVPFDYDELKVNELIENKINQIDSFEVVSFDGYEDTDW